MIVIMAVALIVVGPDKLPDLARSVAKTVLELKKTLNQVKNSLADEENLIGSVKSDLHKTAEDLKGNLLESDHFTLRDPAKIPAEVETGDDDIIDVDNRQPEAESTEEEYRAAPEPDAGPADRPAARPEDKNPDGDATAAGAPDAARK